MGHKVKFITILYSLLFLPLSIPSATAQSNKFTHSLSDYNLQINIDSNLIRRIEYNEMQAAYKNIGQDFDRFLDNITPDAVFLFAFNQQGDKTWDDGNSIRIEVTKDNGIDTPFLLYADDTINTKRNPGYLSTLTTCHTDFTTAFRVMISYDSVTQTYLCKYLGTAKQMADIKNRQAKDKRIITERCYRIHQVFKKDGYYFMIQYNCFQNDQQAYFKIIEEIIGSVH